MQDTQDADILVVDDHLDTRELLAEFLKEDGYSVLGFESAREALSLLQNGMRPGLILIDLEMPTLSGWGFCSALADDPKLRTIPVAVITAVPSYRGVPHRVVDAGVFRKPIDLDSLLEAVRTFVPRHIHA